MPIKRNTKMPKKAKAASFTKKQVKSTSFKKKIERANKLLGETVFLKKKPVTVN